MGMTTGNRVYSGGGCPVKTDTATLLQVKAFPHESLQAGFVQDVVGEFLVGEHGQGGALGTRDQFRSLLDRHVRILTDDRHNHADHDLQAADLLRFLKYFVTLRIVHGALSPRHRGLTQLR